MVYLTEIVLFCAFVVVGEPFVSELVPDGSGEGAGAKALTLTGCETGGDKDD